MRKSSKTLVKRETASTSESAQFILARRSKDSVESASNSQSEAQPGIGCNAIPEAAQSGGSKEPGARAVSQKNVRLCEAGGVGKGAV